MNGARTCLVVGAGGFLGVHVCELLKADISILAATSDVRRLPRPGWIHLDMTQPDTLQNLPPMVDAVVYLAQSPHHKDFPNQAKHIWSVNVQGLLLMLEYARQAGVQHFVLASSGSVYAKSEEVLHEEAPLLTGSGGSFYVRSKIAAELLINAYSVFFSTTSLRFFTMYGAGLGNTMLLARMVRAVQEGLPVTLDGEDGLLFNPLYATDAAQAVAAGLRLYGNHTINVAGPELVTLGQVCRIIGRELGREPVFVHQGSGWKIVADITAMRQLLGEPFTGAEDGLKAYLASILQ